MGEAAQKAKIRSLDAAQSLTEAMQMAVRLTHEQFGDALTDGAIVIAMAKLLADVIEPYETMKQSAALQTLDRQIRSFLKAEVN